MFAFRDLVAIGRPALPGMMCKAIQWTGTGGLRPPIPVISLWCSRDGVSCKWAAAHRFSVSEVIAPPIAADYPVSVAQELRTYGGIGSVASQACDAVVRALGF